LLTEVNVTWNRFHDISFTAGVGHATFTNPVNGQTNTNNARPFTWTTVPGAQGYILVVGTTTYGSDLVNSAILPASQASFSGPNLLKGKVLYATVLTKVNGAFSATNSLPS
jgi:hypothetical protein